MCYAGQSESLLSIIEDLQRLAAKDALERCKPEAPCAMCKPNDLCFWHRRGTPDMTAGTAIVDVKV